MKAVYGSVPPDGKANYPMCMGDFWMFHTGVPGFDKLKKPASDGNCPKKAVAGRLYDGSAKGGHMIREPRTIWSYHPPPFQPFPDNAWVEVIHYGCDAGCCDEHVGGALP